MQAVIVSPSLPDAQQECMVFCALYIAGDV